MTAKRVYFFSGTQYLRYDNALGGVLPVVYPRDIAGSWSTVTAPVDAALNWGNGKVYFFSGSNYFRYDARLDRVDAGYPRPISPAWTDAASAHFGSGVDAAVNWGNGKAYLFKGGEYIRHDIANDTIDPGYPKPIAGNWPGIAGTIFERDIDAAINWGNGKVYWFKDDCYGRLDIGTKALDSGYPKLIAGNWPGVFTSGISGAVEWPMASVAPGGFNVPANRTGPQATAIPGGTMFTEDFDMFIDFDPNAGYPTTCAVGEYRQFVRGEFRRNGVVKTHLLADPNGGPAPAMLPRPAAGAAGDNFQQDGLDHPGPPRQLFFYGHRMGPPFATDVWLPDRETGCQYRGHDGPGAGGATGDSVSAVLDFIGNAVDAASADEVLATASWTVNVGGTA